MKKFTLIIAAVVVGFLPEIAFCRVDINLADDGLATAAEAAQMENDRFNGISHHGAQAAPKVGESSDEYVTEAVRCAKGKIFTYMAKREVVQQQAGTADTAGA